MVAASALLSKTAPPAILFTTEVRRLGTSASATPRSHRGIASSAPWGPQPRGPSPTQTPAATVQPSTTAWGHPAHADVQELPSGSQRDITLQAPCQQHGSSTAPACAARAEAQITAGSVWSWFPKRRERLCCVRAHGCLSYSGLWLLTRSICKLGMAFAEAVAKGKAVGTSLGARDTWVVASAWGKYKTSQARADVFHGPSP